MKFKKTLLSGLALGWALMAAPSFATEKNDDQELIRLNNSQIKPSVSTTENNSLLSHIRNSDGTPNPEGILIQVRDNLRENLDDKTLLTLTQVNKNLRDCFIYYRQQEYKKLVQEKVEQKQKFFFLRVINNPTVKQVILQNYSFQKPCRLLMELFYLYPRLTSFTLRQSEVTNEGAKALATIPTLAKLNLNGNHIDDEGAKDLARNTKLTTLNLGNNLITDDGAKFLARNTKLTTLKLGNNLITDDGAKFLARNTTLTQLDLSDNNISDDGVRVLAKNTKLTNLNLGSNVITDDGAKALAMNPATTNLNLSDNKIGYEGVRALAMKPNLVQLGLSGNKLTDQEAALFATNTRNTRNAKPTKLNILDLSNNNIGDDGAKVFLIHPSLTELNLSENSQITPATKLLLQKNKKLKTLEFRNLW